MTRNYVGTQFGGSMFSMTDPFWMILVMHRLGPEYVVWDKRAEIEFLRPGKTHVQTEFVVDPAVVHELRDAADQGEKVLRWFENDIVDTSGQVVARRAAPALRRRRRRKPAERARQSGIPWSHSSRSGRLLVDTVR